VMQMQRSRQCMQCIQPPGLTFPIPSSAARRWAASTMPGAKSVATTWHDGTALAIVSAGSPDPCHSATMMGLLHRWTTACLPAADDGTVLCVSVVLQAGHTCQAIDVLSQGVMLTQAISRA
jgi:hypothetical protein